MTEYLGAIGDIVIGSNDLLYILISIYYSYVLKGGKAKLACTVAFAFAVSLLRKTKVQRERKRRKKEEENPPKNNNNNLRC